MSIKFLYTGNEQLENNILKQYHLKQYQKKSNN